jgi:hypothetical protein
MEAPELDKHPSPTRMRVSYLRLFTVDVLYLKQNDITFVIRRYEVACGHRTTHYLVF